MKPATGSGSPRRRARGTGSRTRENAGSRRVALLLPDDLLQIGQILLREVFREQVGQSEFDRQPQLEEILFLLLVEKGRIDHFGNGFEDVRMRDHHAAPFFRFDEPHHPQATERFADDRPADLKFLRQLRLHRQPVAGPEVVFPQIIEDLLLGNVGQRFATRALFHPGLLSFSCP